MPATDPDERILVLAPVGHDAPAMASLLQQHGWRADICESAAGGSREIVHAGALLLTEEALELPGIEDLLERLRQQPAWSELPLIILTSGGASRVDRLLDSAATAAGTITLLERPIRTNTLLRSVEVALHSRRRQYQVRDLLDAERRHQEQLRASEDRYRAFIANSSEGIWRMEFEPPLDTSLPVEEQVEQVYRSGRMVECNDAMARMYGFTRAEELQGQPLDFMLPASDPAARDFIAFVIQSGYRVIDAVSSERDAARNTVYFANSMIGLVRNGLLLRMWGTQRDITNNKRAEAALRESEQRYRTLFDSIDEGFCILEMIFDPTDRPVDYRFIEVNVAFERQTGLVNAAGKRMSELTPAHEEHWYELYGRVALTGEAVRFQSEARALHRWFDVYAFRLGPPEQRRVAALFSNITDRRRTEEANARLAAIVELSEDVIIGEDLDGIITSWNRGAERLFGYTAAEAVGQSIALIVPETLHHELSQILDHIRNGRSLEDFETIRRSKNGMLLNVSITISPITDAAGKVMGASKIARNITRQKQAEQSLLRRAEEQAALYKFTDALNRNTSLEEIYEAALDSILAALRCDRASILFFDEAGVMQFVAWRGLSDAYRQAVTGHSPWTVDAKDPTPVTINNVENAGLSDPLQGVMRREGVGALGFIPLVIAGKLVGKFMAYFNVAHAFTQDELNLALTIARQLGFGVARRRAEEALRQSEDRAHQQLFELEAIYQTAPLGLAVIDTQLRFRRINERLATLNGTSVANHIGRTVREIIPSVADQAENAVRTVLETRAPLHFEIHGDTPALPGVERIWDEHWYPLPDESGRITRIGVVAEEITERKHWEDNLHRFSAASAYRVTLADTLRHLSDPVAIQSEAARVLGEHLGANRVQYAQIDATNEFAVVAQEFTRNLPAQPRRYRANDFKSFVVEVRKGNTFVSTDLAADQRLTEAERDRLGAMQAAAIVIIPIIKESRLVAMLAVYNLTPRSWRPEEISLMQETADRTWAAVERARVQQELMESETRYRTLVAQVKDYAIFSLHPNGRPSSWNEGVQRLFGFPEEEFIDHDVLPILFTPEDAQAGVPEKELRQAAETGTASDDRWLRRKDGSYFYAEGVTTAIRNWTGELIGYTKVLRDATAAKQSQDALAEARERLQEHAGNLERTVATRTHDLRMTNEQLEAFVYSIAHDLRAPLRSMIGYSQLLSDDHAKELNDAGRHLLKRIQASSEFMDKLLLDLLAYGRTARAEVESHPVELGRVWESACFQCATQIEESRATIETLEPLPTVMAHEATLGQSLANLLSNALKFVETGERPHVRFWAEDRGPLVRMWIADQGIGIPADQHERIFRVFERSHGARYVGTGIGLSIVRKGVERMGGMVGLESEPGKGSRFWIELPKAE